MADVSRAIDQCQKEIDELKKKLEQLREDDDDADVLRRVAREQNVAAVKVALKPRKILRGHFGKIYSTVWSTDSKRLVSAAQDGKLMLWNTHNAVKLFVISLRSSWVMSCGYSPSGTMVASGGLDNVATVYKLPPSMQQANLKTEPKDPGEAHITAELNVHEGYVSSCRFIDNNSILTSSGDGTCALFDIETQYAKTVFKGHDADVMAVSTVPEDHNIFLSCSVDTTSKLWDARAGENAQMTFEGHESDINSVYLFNGGNTFVSGADDTTVRLFDIRAYKQLSSYHTTRNMVGVTSVGVSASGRILFAGYDSTDFWAWDLQLASPIQVLEKAHTNKVSCLSVSPNGHGLVTGSWDYLLKIWA